MEDPRAGAVQQLNGPDRRLLLICDHASNRLPPGFDLGVPQAALSQHMAYDIGAADLTAALAARFQSPAIFGGWSRLLVDLNRPPQQAIVMESDGHIIPGNADMNSDDRSLRLNMHATYHETIARQVAARRPQLIVSVHSFTPTLATSAQPRPWPIALLWNRDDRATVPALASLRAETLDGPVGANMPYSGQVLNYTMDRHAEASGIAYLGFEVRQDKLTSRAGVAQFSAIMARAIEAALQVAPR